jgi:endogenous inhibitor of DNA gyrase (YacG/DUF329 family)
MAKYFGVKCKTCGTPIALAVRKPILEGKTININVVPLASIVCPECGDSHEHSRDDSLYFDGPDGLLPPV